MDHSRTQAGGVQQFLSEFDRPTEIPELYGPDLRPPLASDRVGRRGDSDISSWVHDYGAQSRYRLKQRTQLSPQAQTQDTLPLSQDSLVFGAEGEDETSIRPEAMEIEVSIQDRLDDALVESVYSRTKYFVPLGELDSICEKDTVTKELRKTFPKDEADQYARYVCGDLDNPVNESNSSRKIFATLVCIGKVETLPCFEAEGIFDRDLPFTPMEKIDVRKLGRRDPSTTRTSTRRWDPRNAQTEPTLIPLRCFYDWPKRYIREFYSHQWQFLAPFIDKAEDDVPDHANGSPIRTVALYELDKEAVMPWTKLEHMEGVGGYADVSRIEIHSDHHNFKECNIFALKTLHSPDWDEFRREFYAFKKIKTQTHLLELYATFKTGNTFSFLFPWAQGGNLKDLWKSQPAKLVDGDVGTLIRWIAQQCLGLANGLDGIHDARDKVTSLDQDPSLLSTPAVGIDDYGIHGDIKPENILHFSQAPNEYNCGILKISDFGLTNFHTRGSISQHEATGPMSPTYRAPERDIRSRFKSRKYDIWALGCVFSELLTWVIRGPDELEKFHTLRFDEVDEGKVSAKGSWKEDRFFKKIYSEDGKVVIPALKSSVARWLEELKANVADGQNANFLGKFLTFIKDSMLEVDYQKRVDVTALRTFLKKQHRKCREDMSYCTHKLRSFTPTSNGDGQSYHERSGPAGTIAMNGVQPDINVIDEHGNEAPMETSNEVRKT